MPVKDRLGLLDRLRGEGAKLDKAQRKAQRQIYASLTYDDDFKVLDDERQDKLSQELGADPDLKDAKNGWAAKSVEDRMKVLQKVLAAECRVYNVPMPEVRLFNAKNPNGFFSDANGTININIRPGGGFDDFQRVMNTMLHENAHNLQYVLIQRLEEGILKPGDPEFNQALVFAANLGGDGYVSSKEDRVIEDDEPVKTAYKNQPAEMHAWDTGGKVSAKILEILQGLDTPAKNVSL